MKRITISLDEEIYLRILDYALQRSKAEMRSVSTSEAIRGILDMWMRDSSNGTGSAIQDQVPSPDEVE